VTLPQCYNPTLSLPESKDTINSDSRAACITLVKLRKWFASSDSASLLLAPSIAASPYLGFPLFLFSARRTVPIRPPLPALPASDGCRPKIAPCSVLARTSSKPLVVYTPTTFLT
jgi:hypothetical protein